jgi:RHS repeat-associated protein
MYPALSARIPDGLLAAMPQLREKPHQGVQSRNTALYLGFNVCKSTTVLGLRAAEHLERVRSRYTGKERDSESGNDYFGARYYASTMGRFLSPDWSAKAEPVPYAKLDNPQSLNLYAYVLNNPLSRADLDGHDWAKAWEKLKASVSQMKATVTIGLGAEVKAKLGKGSGLNVRAGIAIKDNVSFSNGKLATSISGNAGVSAGKQDGTRIGLEGSAEKEVASVNVGTGEVKLGGPGTTDNTVGVSHGDTTAAKSGDGFQIGGEAGEGAVGGGSFSITKEGVSDLKEAAGEAWSSIKEAFGAGSTPTTPTPTVPQPQP